MRWGNLNIATEKSEQTVFAQISLSQYKDFVYRVCLNCFKDCNTKLDHPESLSLSIDIVELQWLGWII